MTMIDLPRKPTWGTELRYQVVQPCIIPSVLRIKALKRALEPQTCKNCRSTMARADNIDDVLLVFRGQ